MQDEAEDSPAVKKWNAALMQQAPLLDDPAGYCAALRSEAYSLHGAMDVDAADLADMLESVDGAYAWAVEELITRELNLPPDA